MLRYHQSHRSFGLGVAIALNGLALGLTMPSGAVPDAPSIEPSSVESEVPVSPTVLPPDFAPKTEDARKLVVDLSDRHVYLYNNADTVTASYPVAIGRAGWETPTGEFSIIRMQQDPYWQHPFNGSIIPPGTENPLGSRWIGFWSDGNNTIGFHGTPTRHSIGQAASHGCVRMYDEDAIALFEQVQVGTPVHVVP